MTTLRGWAASGRGIGRRTAICALLALVLVAGAQGRSATTISITVTTDRGPTGGLDLATYGTIAHISGTLGTGDAGVALVLQASKFPFKDGFVPIGRARTQAGGTYTFSPKPTLATRYRVALALDTASTTRTTTVYVGNGDVSSFGCANGPVCNLHVRGVFIYPPPAAAHEGAKTAYFYVGVSYGSQSHAARVKLVGTGHQRRVGSNRFQVEFNFSFPTPGQYHYNWVTCTKDTEAVDGFGLPGHHHCGDRAIPYPAFTQWTG